MPDQPGPARHAATRSTLPRAAFRASPLLLTAFLLTSTAAPSTPSVSETASAPQDRGTDVAPSPVPGRDPRSPQRTAATSAAAADRALHVSPRGRIDATGTRTDPLRTIGAALSRAGRGQVILVHRGVYHEQLEIPTGKRVRIRAADGAPVWLDGSRLVRRWRSTPHGFVHRGWLPEFDSSPTYTRGALDHTEAGWSFIDPRRPMAAHPDQVWIDGRAQRQVGSLAQVRPGTFFVDDAGDALHLGSSPRGHQVRATALDRAISVRASGTTIEGIGVRRFGPSVPQMGAVTVEAARVSLRGLVIRDNATTGLHVTAPGVRLRAITTAGNGMLGLSATYADGLRVVGLRSQRNNTEGFNTSPVAGGAKVGRSRRVTVRRSVFAANAGTGLWFDESSSDVRVLDTSLRDNARHGLSLEISARALVADTVISGNAGDGIKVNDTHDVRLWNNTIVGNGRALNLVQDDREPSSADSPGRDPRQPFPDPTMTWRLGRVAVHNNILGQARSAADCLLCVEDYSGLRSADQMRVLPTGNVYQRPSAARPSWAVVWSRGAGDPAVFHTLAAFRRATGHESRHLDLIGRRAVTATLAASPWVTGLTPIVALTLPQDVADVLGRPRSRHLGAWLGVPARD